MLAFHVLNSTHGGANWQERAPCALDSMARWFQRRLRQWHLCGLTTLPQDLDPRVYYELLFWGGGHVLQFTFTLLMLVS